MLCVTACPKCPEEYEGVLPMHAVLATEQVSKLLIRFDCGVVSADTQWGVMQKHNNMLARGIAVPLRAMAGAPTASKETMDVLIPFVEMANVPTPQTEAGAVFSSNAWAGGTDRLHQVSVNSRPINLSRCGTGKQTSTPAHALTAAFSFTPGVRGDEEALRTGSRDGVGAATTALGTGAAWPRLTRRRCSTTSGPTEHPRCEQWHNSIQNLA